MPPCCQNASRSPPSSSVGCVPRGAGRGSRSASAAQSDSQRARVGREWRRCYTSLAVAALRRAGDGAPDPPSWSDSVTGDAAAGGGGGGGGARERQGEPGGRADGKIEDRTGRDSLRNSLQSDYERERRAAAVCDAALGVMNQRTADRPSLLVSARSLVKVAAMPLAGLEGNAPKPPRRPRRGERGGGVTRGGRESAAGLHRVTNWASPTEAGTARDGRRARRGGPAGDDAARAEIAAEARRELLW